MTAPRYVDFGALMTPPAPFDSIGTTLYGFIARADGQLLDDLCQKVFAEPTGGEVDVLAIGDRVMLTWGSIERVNSLTEPYDSYGGVAEPQVCVWVPVAFVERDGDDVVAKRFAMFTPYLWVDNAMSLATGRELFGYPKSWSWIGFPDEDAAPRRWTLDVFGLDYDPDAIARRHPLMKIVEGDTLEGDGEDPWYDGIVHLARDVGRRLLAGDGDGDEEMDPSFRLAGGLAGDLVHRRLRHVFLKQVRSIKNGTTAALQQVTQCNYEIERIRGRPRLCEFSLTVERLDSHPVISELGLQTQSLHLGYEIEMDFRVGDGEVLWDASGRRW